MWMSIQQEFPEVSHPDSDATLCSGWRVCSEKEKPLPLVFPDQEHIVNSCFSLIGNIARGGVSLANGAPVKKVGDRERVIGTVKNQRTHALYTLCDKVQESAEGFMPSGIRTTEEAREWVESQTISSLRRTAAMQQLVEDRHAKVYDLMWASIHDELHDVILTSESGNRSLRENWQVVELPASIDESPLVVPLSETAGRALWRKILQGA
jgi:hypothetical protein